MKITTFDPLIVSHKAADAIQVFEDLGFVKTHAPVTETETGENLTVRLKDSNGFHVDVSQVDSFPQDVTIIMNP